MSIRKRSFLLLGSAYRLIYRLPVIGEPAVRGIAKALGYLSALSPYGPKKHVSMSALREDLGRLFEMTDMDIDAINQDEERIELVLTSCPYGYCRPEHAGVCDAAMDFDRTMFGRCGYELAIDACIPHGAPACRVSIRDRPAKTV